MDGLVVKVATKSTRKHAKCDLSIPEDNNNNQKNDIAQTRLQDNQKSM
jgi:hypothetical protein